MRKLRQSGFADNEWAYYGVTVGTVADTNDPQQMGRVRVLCRGLNDPIDPPITEIPWAMYATPFGGTLQAGTRGVDSNVTGPVAYGMWAIPKLGSQVLVMCLDGNPQTRVWIGCLHTDLATHTMPHGRFSYQDNDNLPSDETPAGPFDHVENVIEPLHTNLRQAFGADTPGKDKQNFEFQSRAADYQVSGVVLGQNVVSFSEVEDDQDEKVGDASLGEIDLKANNPKDKTVATGSRQGYQTSRLAPDQFTSLTPRNLDNTVTAIVSPGFHAMSMDDRQENCRFRIRTTGGHQIIMDDTNERIYISTASGENWIEMDEQGNIDIFTSGKLSVHAEHDINFTSERSIRMYGKAGIHLKSDKEVRVTAQNDISLNTTSGTLRAKSKDNMLLESENDIHLKASKEMRAEAAGNVDIKSGETLRLEGKTTNLRASTGEIKIQAKTNTNIDGAKVNLATGGIADPADSANASEGQNFVAFFTNRIPEHEPWARVDTRANDVVESTEGYEDANVGRKRRITAVDGIKIDETDITRGKNWRR